MVMVHGGRMPEAIHIQAAALRLKTEIEDSRVALLASSRALRVEGVTPDTLEQHAYALIALSYRVDDALSLLAALYATTEPPRTVPRPWWRFWR